jgi:hypothetical protein
MNISYIGSGLSPFGEAMTPKEQRELQESAAASKGSGISFVGHTPSFKVWVFNVNGKSFVGQNFSTQSPLQLSFIGAWDKYPSPSNTEPLINTSGFKITDSTATNMIWQWAGKQYTSSWNAKYDEDDPESVVYLNFGPPVPYTGPARTPVGNDVKTTPPVQGGGESQTRRTQTGGGTSSTTTSTPPAAEPAKPTGSALPLLLGAAYLLLS